MSDHTSRAGGPDRRRAGVAAVTATAEEEPKTCAGNTTIGAAAVLTAAALWGTVGPAQVLAASAADPGALGVARLLLGGLGLALFCRRPAAWRAVMRRDVIGWVFLAALATGVYQIAFMHAVDELGAALGTTIALGVAPITTGLCAHWWTRERLTLGWTLGTVAAVAGCVVLLNPWGAEQISATGVGIALISGSCYGVYTVAAKRFLQAGAPALPATTITLLIAGIALSPLLRLHGGHLTDPNSLLLIAWIALAGTTTAYAVFVHGLHRTTAPTAGTLSLAEPLLSAVLGVLVLHERLSPSATLGCLILLAGLATVTLVDARPRSTGGRDTVERAEHRIAQAMVVRNRPGAPPRSTSTRMPQGPSSS
jgi:drug/metabolite transporter, DME family